MDVFIHPNLEKGCARMGVKETPYCLSSVYSRVDYHVDRFILLLERPKQCKGVIDV